MEYVEIDFELVHETDEAVLIKGADKQGWVPKSCIEDGQFVDYDNDSVLNMAQWFAEKERWI